MLIMGPFCPALPFWARHPLSHPAPASRPAQGIPARIPPCPPTPDAHGAPRPRICQATASPAPAQDVARRILGEDVTQIDDYTECVKRLVGKVLTGNGITRYDQGTYALVGGDELSDAEQEELLQLCRQRLDQSPGAHPGPRPLRMLRGTLLLGKPRTNGPRRWTTSCPGTRAVRTTSAPCRPSASAAMPASEGRCEADCGYFALEGSGRVLLENELALCIADADPVTPGRSLVIPRCTSRSGTRWWSC